MNDIILIGLIAVFAIFLIVLIIKNKDKKEKGMSLPRSYRMEKTTDFSDVNIKNNLNLVDNKSNTIGGIVASQEKKQAKGEENLVKPIGWVSAKSYAEDVQSANVSKYVPDKEVEQVEIENKSAKEKRQQVSILLVDDSITVLKFISNLLSKFNYELILKEDGVEASEYLEETDKIPDLIVTDLEMPKMSGEELIKHIRGIHKFANVPILIVSSNPTPYIYLLEESLVNGIIQKPFDKEDFVQQIKYLINNS